MRATGHYVRPTKRASVPSSVFALVVHPYHHTEHRAQGVDRQTWGSAEIAHCTRRAGRWSVAAEYRTDSQDALRAWMDSRALKRCTNWVIAPSAGEALTLTGWWDYAESRGVHFRAERRHKGGADDNQCDGGAVTVSAFVPSDPPFILAYATGFLRWRWVSERNYWTDGGAVAGIRASGSGADGGRGLGAGDDERDGAVSECGALLSRFRGLCDWWLRIARAPLGLTAGQCATGILRSYVPPRSLCTHTDEDVHRLERSAAHGGRASVWYVGLVAGLGAGRARSGDGGQTRAARTLSGPVHQLDVSSMYPWLLRDRDYPTKLGPCYTDIRPDALVNLCRGTGVVARVTISTPAGEYPYRLPDGTCYPVGRFTTTLAGPDILAVAAEGSIDAVHFCATYRMGAPFKEGMDALLSARADAVRNDDADAHALSKLVSVSLAGRLAMREGGWSRCPLMDEPGRWGQEFSIAAGPTGHCRYRWICGAAWRWDADKCPRGPHTAAFAYLTAYGRAHMRALRAHCPPRSVYSQCIDGLYCSAEAYRSLSTSGSLTGTGPGRLRLVGTSDSAEFYGPRHYRFGSRWVLSGYHAPTVDPMTREVSYSCRTPLFGARASAAPDAVYTIHRRESIPTDIERGKVGEDGWVLAPHVRDLSARKKRER